MPREIQQLVRQPYVMDDYTYVHCTGIRYGCLFLVKSIKVAKIIGVTRNKSA